MECKGCVKRVEQTSFVAQNWHALPVVGARSESESAWPVHLLLNGRLHSRWQKVESCEQRNIAVETILNSNVKKTTGTKVVLLLVK